MKMQEAMDIMNNKPKGFMVSFERCGDGFLRSDHFPDKHAGEPLIATEHEAWELARDFARAAKGRVCNLYVIDSTFQPVRGYESRMIDNRTDKP
jgi:hypothetical protein